MRKIFSLFAAMLVVLTANATIRNISPTQCFEGTRNDGYTLYVELARGAQAGDTIVMADGEYLEGQSIPVNVPVVIMAAEGAKPVVKMSGYFQVKASINVQGVTFQFVGAEGNGYCFYFYENTPKFLKMKDCEFKNYTQYVVSSWEKYHIDSCIVEDCYFHDLAKAPFYFAPSSLPNDTNACDNLTVKNSTFANITLKDVAVLDLRNNGNNTQATSKLRVDHCTFYNCKGYERMIQSYKSPDASVSNCIMMNPLADAEEPAIYATYLYGGDVKNCVWYQTKRVYTKKEGGAVDNLNVDPKFKDAANADYTLADDSPALTAGTDGKAVGDPRWWPAPAAKTTLYCKMTQSWWTVDGAAVGIYAWDGGGNPKVTWPGERMTPVEGEEGVWSFELDTDTYKNCIFTRVNGNGAVSDWGAKTKDLTIPTDGKNLFTITSSSAVWGDPGCDGEWSVYGATPLAEAPDAAPAAPTWPANQVKAVYSDTYSADCNFGEWGSGTAYTQDTYGKKYVTTNSGYFGLEFKEHLNCSKMEKLHLDVWVAADASMRIVPIWGGAEQGITKNLTGQQWNSVEIALSEFNQVTNWADVYQIKIDNAKTLTFWLNNVYFYTTQAPAVDETAPADVKAVVESASYFSVKIKASATDASEAVKLTVKNGEAEVASINAVSGADAILTVNNLKPNTDYNFSVIASDESGNTAEPVAVAAKTIVAPAADAAPKTYKGLVKSIYSDKYAAAPASIGTLVAGWWEPTELSQGEIAQGDNALFYAPKATGMFGWEFAETDMTGFPYLHISIYPLADGKIKIFPVVNGSTDDYVNIPDVKGGEWNHLVFDFSGKDLTKVFQIGWQDYYTLNGFFVDNVYFSQEKEDVAGADRRINAYGLNVVADGDNYTFSYIANIDGTEANLIFYQDGVEKGTVAIAAPVKGQNQASVAKSDIPNGINTWAVELKAGQVFEFGKLAEGANLKKCHLAIDNSPESDFFGRMYVANRAGSADGGIYVYNQDYTVNTENTLAGQPKWQSMGRPSVGADGTVYIGDWGDAHGGVYVMNPSTLTATCLFEGEQDANGVWTNNGVALGSSTASVGVYGEGANTVLYAMNEDVSSAGTTLYKHGVNVYQLGQNDGTILSKWTVAPTKTFALSDNAAEMFVINATSKGAFFSCSRAKPNNAAGARSLQFYNTNGERTYVALPEGETADLTGSLGGGCAVSRDEDELAIVDGDGNILVYAIAWTGDVPALTKVSKYETAFAALGSLCFDYAGNIVVTAGANYNNSTANHLVAYGVPTANNEIIVPAKKALVVAGADQGTAIEDVTVQPVQKFFRDGQIYIIRDGVVYTITGNVVR
ncbi:MAG: DUF5123 domain-containing protein [Paludibacteraceae bacterium]|nr:DUF5123 domain-containing protein [Paludibacteraceae bacterium]